MVTLVKKEKSNESDFLPNTHRIASIAFDFKAKDIAAYDVRGLTLVSDSFVMCSATSEPQFKAIMNGVRMGMKEIGVNPLHIEGTTQGGWILMDYGNIIFHIFREEAREYYDLDGLWGDAARIELDISE